MKNVIGFGTEDKVDVLMEIFEYMVTEVRKVDLVTNLEYALSLQFVDRLEKSGKKNSIEKLRLKDVLKTEDGE